MNRQMFSLLVALLISGCASPEKTNVSTSGPPVSITPYPSSALANDAPWIDKGIGNGMRFQMKLGSFGAGRDSNGNGIVGSSGRIERLSNGRTELVQIFAKLEDCKRGMGTLHVVSVQGSSIADSDFILDAGTVASNMADSLCATARANGDL